MPNKVGRNEPCPCGSGRKFKRCCGALGAVVRAGVVPHTKADRAAAFQKLDAFIDDVWHDMEDEAFEDFWGRHVDREDELPLDLLGQSRDVEETWFAFDHALDDGRRIVDHFLAQEPYLSPGERSFLLALRESTMRLYEVIDTVPGSTMTPRDLVEGTVVTVAERTASRSIPRRDCLVARVIPRGCSGRPEMERGVLHIPGLRRDQLVAQVIQHRDDFLHDHPDKSVADFYKRFSLRAFLDGLAPRPVTQLRVSAHRDHRKRRIVIAENGAS